MKTTEEKAIELAKLMIDGKGNDVTLLISFIVFKYSCSTGLIVFT